MSPEFRKLLNKAMRLLIRELSDGCDMYRTTRALCDACRKYAMDATLKPRDYVQLPGCKFLIPFPQCKKG